MLKNTLLIISNVILNYIIFIQYLKTANYSGGEVGMVPLIILLVSFISFICSILTIFITKRFSDFSFLKTLSTYNIFYFIIFLFWGLNPLEGQGFLDNLDLFIILIAVFSMLIVLSGAYLEKKYFSK